MKTSIKDITGLKDELIKASGKGFGHFMKNLLFTILLVAGMFMLTNFESLSNPKEFFGNFTIDSLWSGLILFFVVAGLYQIGRNLLSEQQTQYKEQRIDDVEEALTRKEEAVKKHHADMVMKRFEIGPLVSNELKSLLINLDADRAAILEMHNGTNNSSGLPFIYGDMAYEEISPKVGYASDDFKNFNLAKLPFVSLHYNERTWIGAVDDIEKDDPYFAAKLRRVEVNYGAFVILEGINGPIGFLTLFFKDAKNHPTKAKIIAELNHSSQILSTLLDRARE